jgi:hypothetical protein
VAALPWRRSPRGWTARSASRPVDGRPVQQQVLHLRHRRRLAGLGRRLDVAAGHSTPAARSGAGRHSHWRSVLPVYRRQHRRAAQGGGQHDLDEDARPGVPRLQMGRGRGGRFLGRRRGLQCDRSGCVPRSERRPTVAGLRLLLRLHPPRRARSQDGHAQRPERHAPRSRDQLRGRRADLPRRLVLPAGHPRQRAAEPIPATTSASAAREK